MFQLVRNSTNGWEKAGVGFLHGSVAGCCSQANRSLSGPPVPISAPYPLPPKLGWTQFSVTSLTFLLLRTHAWPLGVLPSSTESAARRVRGSPGGRVPGRAQGWKRLSSGTQGNPGLGGVPRLSPCWAAGLLPGRKKVKKQGIRPRCGSCLLEHKTFSPPSTCYLPSTHTLSPNTHLF